MENRYQIEHCDGPTIIKAQGYDPQLPTLVARVVPDGDHCMIYIYIGDDLAAITTIWRGKAFAVKVARGMLTTCLSRLGKHRRSTANRAKRVAGETPPLLGHPLGGQPSAGGYSLPVRGVAI